MNVERGDGECRKEEMVNVERGDGECRRRRW